MEGEQLVMEGIRDHRAVRFYRAKKALTWFIYRNMDSQAELEMLRGFWWKVAPLFLGMCFFLGIVCFAIYAAVAI